LGARVSGSIPDKTIRKSFVKNDYYPDFTRLLTAKNNKKTFSVYKQQPERVINIV